MSKVCKRCGKLIEGRRSVAEFCSRQCLRVFHRETPPVVESRECIRCLKTFEVAPHSTQWFCENTESPSCRLNFSRMPNEAHTSY